MYGYVGTETWYGNELTLPFFAGYAQKKLEQVSLDGVSPRFGEMIHAILTTLCLA